jgi:hypothetical protein
MERRNGSHFSFHGFGPPPVRDGWFLVVVIVMVFVEVALIGEMF